MKPDEIDEPIEDPIEDNGDGSGALNVLEGLIKRPDPLAGEEPPYEESKF